MKNLTEPPVEANAPPASPALPGPKSDAAKAICSMNALKHGCCAAGTLLLPNETEEQLKALESTWLKLFNPKDEGERKLVAEVVNADWFYQRATRAHAAVEVTLYEINPDPSAWTEEQERKLARHVRYKTAASNLVDKKRKAVEDHRKFRQTESDRAAKLTIAKERLEVYKKKNRPEQTWDEHLAEMKKQAVALGFKPPEFNPAKRY